MDKHIHLPVNIAKFRCAYMQTVAYYLDDLYHKVICRLPFVSMKEVSLFIMLLTCKVPIIKHFCVFGRRLLARCYDVHIIVHHILTLFPTPKRELLVSLPVCVISVDSCGQVLVMLQATVVWHVKTEVLHHSFALNTS